MIIAFEEISVNALPRIFQNTVRIIKVYFFVYFSSKAKGFLKRKQTPSLLSPTCSPTTLSTNRREDEQIIISQKEDN